MSPLPSCLNSLFESEVKYEAIDLKMIFIPMQIKLVFIRKVVHLASS